MRVQDSTEPQGPDGREHLKPVATRASGHGMPCPYNNNSLTSNKILNILITVLTASHYIWSDKLHANEGKAKRREMSGVVSAPPRSIEAMRSTSSSTPLNAQNAKLVMFELNNGISAVKDTLTCQNRNLTRRSFPFHQNNVEITKRGCGLASTSSCLHITFALFNHINRTSDELAQSLAT